MSISSTENPLHILNCQTQDARAIAALQYMGQSPEAADADHQAPEDYELTIQQLTGDILASMKLRDTSIGHTRLLAGWVGHQLVAFCDTSTGGHSEGQAVTVFNELVVNPRFRRKGVARQLITFAASISENPSKLRATVSCDDIDSQSLFKACGFEQIRKKGTRITLEHTGLSLRTTLSPEERRRYKLSDPTLDAKERKRLKWLTRS